MKNNWLALSNCVLAVSVLTGSLFIVNELNEKDATIEIVKEAPEVQKETNPLLNQEELAVYLGITVQEATLLGPRGAGTGWTESYIPAIRIGEKNYFARSAVDEWLKTYGGIISGGE